MGMLVTRLFSEPRCSVCLNVSDRAQGDGSICSACLVEIETARCRENDPAGGGIYTYHGAVRTLMHRYKFEGALELADFIAAAYSSALKKRYFRHYSPEDTVILSIPSGKTAKRRNGRGHMERVLGRLRREGYTTQSHVLARRPGTPQKGLSREARLQNMRDRLYLKREVAGLGVLLIDDVRTTGATIEAAREILISAGAARVDWLCFAID